MSIEKLDFTKTSEKKIQYTVLNSKVVQKIKDGWAGYVWVYLSSLPPDWAVNKNHLKNHFGIGEQKVKKIMSYLKKVGLIEYVMERNEDGSFNSWSIDVFCGDSFREYDGNQDVNTSGMKTHPVVSHSNGKTIHTNTITNTNSKKINKSISIPSENLLDGFDEFKQAYPNKKDRSKAKKIWIKKKLHQKKDLIIDHVKLRILNDSQWKDSKFVPLPSTFLNNDRWEDVYQTNDRPSQTPAKPNGKAKYGCSDMLRESREYYKQQQGEVYEQ